MVDNYPSQEQGKKQTVRCLDHGPLTDGMVVPTVGMGLKDVPRTYIGFPRKI